MHCTLTESQKTRLTKKKEKKRQNAQTENADMQTLYPNRAYISFPFFKKDSLIRENIKHS